MSENANPVSEQVDEPQIEQLIYASAASTPFSQSSLKDLLRKARRNNASLNVTGLLLHVEGSFLQILEGDPDVVESLFQRINADSRHGNVLVIWRGMVKERTFGEWRMGFRDVTAEDLRNLSGFDNFLQSGHTLMNISSDQAKRVLHAFHDGRWRQSAA